MCVLFSANCFFFICTHNRLKNKVYNIKPIISNTIVVSLLNSIERRGKNIIYDVK